MNKTKWLGYEITETDKNQYNESESHTKFEITGKYERPEIIFGAMQYMAKFFPKLSEQTDRLRKLLKKNGPWKWGSEQETDFN